MVIGPQEDAGGIGKRCGNVGQERVDRAEVRQLLAVERVIRRIGAGEMAHQQRWRDCRKEIAVIAERPRFGDGKAEAVHARIDMDGRAGRRAILLRRRPFGDFRERAEHGAKVGRDVSAGCAGQEAVEDVDDGVRNGMPEANAFVGKCDEEGMAAGTGKRIGGRFKADAVAVAFDDGRDGNAGFDSGCY